MTYVFEHRADGRHTSVYVRDDCPFPMIEATYKLRMQSGYPDDWDIIAIEDYRTREDS